MDAGLNLVDGDEIVFVQYIVQHYRHSQKPMRTGRLQSLVQLVFTILTSMSENDVIMLDSASPEHLDLRLLWYGSTLDGLFHIGCDGFFALIERHVDDVEVACFQQLEQEAFLLAILVVPQFISYIERQVIPWAQDVLQTSQEEIKHIVEF